MHFRPLPFDKEKRNVYTIQYDTIRYGKSKCVPFAQDERIDKKAVTILDNMMQYYAVRYGTLSQ
jgi:hypothetical protein